MYGKKTSIYVKQEIAVESDHKPLGTIERAPLSQHHPDCRGYSSKCRSMTTVPLKKFATVGGTTRRLATDATGCLAASHRHHRVFIYSLIYKPGKELVIPGMLSRTPLPVNDNSMEKKENTYTRAVTFKSTHI